MSLWDYQTYFSPHKNSTDGESSPLWGAASTDPGSDYSNCPSSLPRLKGTGISLGFFFPKVKILPWKALRTMEILLPLGRLGPFSQ